jgi:selenocysteine lyase/cysteine desulfurase
VLTATRDADADFDFAALRTREFARLDRHGLAYLDYAATALYGASQLRAHHALLARELFGNPHSESEPSRRSSQLIDHAREQVLAWFGVDAVSHAVIFTHNASAASKLVAESYPFGPRAGLVLAADNHNSIVGVREFARRAEAPIHILPLDAELRLDDPAARVAAVDGAGLVALPAQSNFSGVRHPLALVAIAKQRGFDVLLDAAAYVPTSRLDLRTCRADFTVLSFHKMFGHPTSVGALIARRDALARLRRPWFAGGTVKYASIGADLHRLLDDHAGFEDGTPDVLGIAALAPGFALLDEVGSTSLARHVARLTERLLAGLTALRHDSGAPVVHIYGPRTATRDRGAIVAFNVLDATGAIIPHALVEARARDAHVALRGGCFCNPGASEAAFGLAPAAIAACAATSPASIATCLGNEVGAVRLSLGLANNDRDIDRACAAIESGSDTTCTT